MAEKFDLVVIGGGSGGLAGAQRAAEYGARVALIESGRLGGTCVNVGCVPKKIMWNAAEVGGALHDAADYGFSAPEPGHDWAALKNRRDAYVHRLNGVYAMNLAMIRKAAQMTQVEVARKLGVGQGVVSRLEHRDDTLLSTLYDYLMATGAGIVVTVHGQRIELDLARLRSNPEQQTA